MKFLLLLLIMSSNAWTEEDEYKQCIPPAQPFVEEKIRKSYNFDVGETELKDIVIDQKNYAQREEVKALKRRLMFTKRRDVPPLMEAIKTNFDLMVENTDSHNLIQDFPARGSSALISGSEEGTLMISMNNLSQEDLDFIPPESLKKLGKNVNIHYKYPYDAFEYFVTYDGVEQPIDKAIYKMMDEFEDACILRMKENRRIKEVEKNWDKATGKKGGAGVQ